MESEPNQNVDAQALNLPQSKPSNKKKIREAIRDWLQIIAIFIAACWSGYVFIYEKYWEPSRLPLFISINGKPEKVSEDKEFELYKINISIQNKSHVRETIVSSWFEAKGYKLISRNYNSELSYKDSIKLNGSATRYYDYGKSDLIDWEKIMADNSSMSPNQEYNVSYLILIPKNKYEVLRLNYFTIIDKARMFENKGQLFDIERIINKDGNIALNLTIKGALVKSITSDDIFNRNPAIAPYIKKYKIYYSRTVNDFSLGLIDSTNMDNKKLPKKQ